MYVVKEIILRYSSSISLSMPEISLVVLLWRLDSWLKKCDIHDHCVHCIFTALLFWDFSLLP